MEFIDLKKQYYYSNILDYYSEINKNQNKIKKILNKWKILIDNYNVLNNDTDDEFWSSSENKI